MNFVARCRPIAIAIALVGAAGCASSAAPVSASHPSAKARRGFAVLAHETQIDRAWTLARETYASPRLRPTLDESVARTFAGQAPSHDEAARDLAQTRDAIRDEGAASRKLLLSLADEHGLEGVVVLDDAEPPTAHVFFAEGARFESVLLRPDADGLWLNARSSLERLAGPEKSMSQEPSQVRPEGEKSKAFYASPWFWGAAGAALAIGAAVFVASQDTSSDSIRLQMQVPR